MYQKTVLDNGLRVITEAMPTFNSVTLGIWANVGSRHESYEDNGITHFLEHLMFKGTEHHSASDIAEIMDGVGGHLNAFTEKEQTCYYAHIMDRHLPLALELLADMLRHSLFDPEEMEREKNVVLEEIRMYEDSPDEIIFDLFTQTLLDGHPLGQSTLGRHDVIQSLTRDDLVGFVEEHYTPQNLMVAAAGNLEHQQVVELAETMFGDLTGNLRRRHDLTPTVKKARLLRYRDTEQVYICMGNRGLSARDERKYTMFLLDSILGGSMSSRLFQEIRERRGLVYSVSSFRNAYLDIGLSGIFAGTGPQNMDEVIGLIRSILADLHSDGITDKELARAKEHFKGNFVLGLESTGNRMIRLAKSEFFHGRLVPHEEVVEKIEAVTREEINQLADSYLNPADFSLVVLGPVDGEPAAAVNSILEA